MIIRDATIDDWSQIKILLDQLGYWNTESFIKQKVEDLIACKDHHLIVCEVDKVVIAFVSMHFLPLLGVKGDLAVIDYFSVDENYRHKGIGSLLEDKCVSLARERQCSKIQLHCNLKRVDAHVFYRSKGYRDYPLYFKKELTY